ncbi:hypothetical protein KSP40_PGU017466 [Platanthera guangdongensis]|uniref:EF-hand domain-containing protein n=1 Tax=Platanthera guangdongensis TaxID=2320717 RepID=A0ABR2LQ39_9ASPA
MSGGAGGDGLAPEMERMFKKFDANGDGKISKSELAEALRTLGSTSNDDVHRMMVELDTDGDGFIDFNEFAAFCRNNPGLMKDVSKPASTNSRACHDRTVRAHVEKDATSWKPQWKNSVPMGRVPCVHS